MKKLSIFLVSLFSITPFFYSCKSTSYPCPAYSDPSDKSTMRVGPDGTPINSVDRQFDENGLIKKKKVKKIHK
jgi:hypothetical protein